MTTTVRFNLISATPVAVRGKQKRKSKNAPGLNMSKKRMQARAVKRIFDKNSGELVGWLYEWNTGEVVPRWQGEAIKDVYYE
ncbi:MAG: hypothetical protein AAFR98_12485 [Pseudomonadota bacterium]